MNINESGDIEKLFKEFLGLTRRARSQSIRAIDKALLGYLDPHVRQCLEEMRRAQLQEVSFCSKVIGLNVPDNMIKDSTCEDL